MSLDPCGRPGDDGNAVQPGTAMIAKGEGPSLAAGFSLPADRHLPTRYEGLGLGQGGAFGLNPRFSVMPPKKKARKGVIQRED